MAQARMAAKGAVRGVFFSLGTTPATDDPQLDCVTAIVDLLNQTLNTAHVAIFSLTEPRIVAAMIAAHQRGVDISVVADAGQAKEPGMAAMIRKLTAAGVDIRLAVRQTAFMHNKVGIFDGMTVATGSFNWTSQAEHRNDENLLVVDGTDLAADYEKYVFQRILTGETANVTSVIPAT